MRAKKAAAPARVDLEPAFAARLLEELIYERVRTHVDLLQLGWFESDLDASIGRVMQALDARGVEPSSGLLAAALVDRAWRRVEAEWQARRAGAADACPLCEDEPARAAGA